MRYHKTCSDVQQSLTVVYIHIISHLKYHKRDPGWQDGAEPTVLANVSCSIRWMFEWPAQEGVLNPLKRVPGLRKVCLDQTSFSCIWWLLKKAYTQTANPSPLQFLGCYTSIPIRRRFGEPQLYSSVRERKIQNPVPRATVCTSLPGSPGSGQGGLGSSTRSGEACPLCTLLQYRHAKIGESKKQWTCMSATHSWMPLQILARPQLSCRWIGAFSTENGKLDVFKAPGNL